MICMMGKRFDKRLTFFMNNKGPLPALRNHSHAESHHPPHLK
jgi:hypothetical protein